MKKFWLKVEKYFKKAEDTFPKKLPIKRAQFIMGIAIAFSFIILLLSFFDFSWLNKLLGTESKKETIQFIGIGIAGLIGLFNVLAVLKRVVAQEKIADAQLKNNEVQHDSNEQKAFNDAIINLGSDKESVRLGGIYNLYKMAINKPAEAENISEILCAHARSTTQKKDYQEEYSKKPSNEIQSLLNILSRKKENPFKKIPLDLSSILDLSSTYLRGADLRGAWLQGALLSDAQLQEANLWRAQLQGAILSGAQLQGAYLSKAQLQEAYLIDAQLQGADLKYAQLQEANLWRAQLQGAKLTDAQLQEAYLYDAQLQGAILSGTQLQGAYLWHAQLQGAYLSFAQLQGAKLIDAQLQGAKLIDTQLQGAFTEDTDSSGGFKQRIERRIGKNTELRDVIFAGGITKKYIKDLEKYLSPMVEKKFLKQKWLDDLIKALAPHIEKERDRILPENSGATTGILTNKIAEEIIKKYDKAMNYKKSSQLR